MMYCSYLCVLNVSIRMCRCFRFELPIPNRNRYVPDRYVPLLIFRNIGFVFSSVFSVPASISGKKIQKQKWLGNFPDRSRPFSSLLPAFLFPSRRTSERSRTTAGVSMPFYISVVQYLGVGAALQRWILGRGQRLILLMTGGLCVAADSCWQGR